MASLLEHLLEFQPTLLSRQTDEAMEALTANPPTMGRISTEQTESLILLVSNSFAGGGLTLLFDAMAEEKALGNLTACQVLDICYGNLHFVAKLQAAGRVVGPKPLPAHATT